MTYRLLDVDTEWPLIEPEFTSRGVSLPDPRFSMIVGAIDDAGTLAGFVVCKMQMHSEPLVVYNPVALRGLLRQAEKEIVERLGPTDYFVFVDGHSEDIARVWGGEKLPLNIYKKRVE